MKKFIIPYNESILYEGQYLKTWGVKYEETSMGEFVGILCLNLSGGCDGKIIDFLLEDALIDIQKLVEAAKKEIKSWKKKVKNLKRKKVSNV